VIGCKKTGHQEIHLFLSRKRKQDINVFSGIQRLAYRIGSRAKVLQLSISF